MRCALYAHGSEAWRSRLATLGIVKEIENLPRDVRGAPEGLENLPQRLRLGRLWAMSNSLEAAYGDGAVDQIGSNLSALKSEARAQFAAWYQVLSDLAPDLLVAKTSCPGGLAAAAEELRVPIAWIEYLPSLDLEVLIEADDATQVLAGQCNKDERRLLEHLESKLPKTGLPTAELDKGVGTTIGFIAENPASGRIRRDALDRSSQHAALLRIARDLGASVSLRVFCSIELPWRTAALKLKNVISLENDLLHESLGRLNGLVCVTGEAVWEAPLIGVPVLVLTPRHPALLGEGYAGVFAPPDWGDMRADLDRLIREGSVEDRTERAVAARSAFLSRFAGLWLQADKGAQAA